MSISDYRRPADYQVDILYECTNCRAETSAPSCYGVSRCDCGGTFNQVGESYPADSSEWHEERDNVNDEHRNPYQR